MNALERISAILARARYAGGWDDDVVAARVLKAIGLDDDGHQIGPPSDSEEPTSSNLGHG